MIHLKLWSYVFHHFLLLIASSVGAYCLYNHCQKGRNQAINLVSNTSIQYQPINTIDPDFDESDNRRQGNIIIGGRILETNNSNIKTTSSSSLSASSRYADHMNNMNINMDMLSMTAPTQNFTSKQHKTHQLNTHSLQLPRDAI